MEFNKNIYILACQKVFDFHLFYLMEYEDLKKQRGISDKNQSLL